MSKHVRIAQGDAKSTGTIANLANGATATITIDIARTGERADDGTLKNPRAFGYSTFHLALCGVGAGNLTVGCTGNSLDPALSEPVQNLNTMLKSNAETFTADATFMYNITSNCVVIRITNTSGSAWGASAKWVAALYE